MSRRGRVLLQLRMTQISPKPSSANGVALFVASANRFIQLKHNGCRTPSDLVPARGWHRILKRFGNSSQQLMHSKTSPGSARSKNFWSFYSYAHLKWDLPLQKCHLSWKGRDTSSAIHSRLPCTWARTERPPPIVAASACMSEFCLWDKVPWHVCIFRAILHLWCSESLKKTRIEFT